MVSKSNGRALKVEFEESLVKPGVSRGEWHGGPFTAVLYRYEAGCEFPDHAHEAAQFTTVLSGRLEFIAGPDRFELGPGECLYIPGGLPHGACVPAEAGPAVSVNIFYPPRKEHP